MAISLPIVSKFDDKGVNAAERALKGVAVAGAAAFAAAIAGAVAFGVEAVKAAAEAEAVTRGLQNAAKNAGVFGDQAASIAKATDALDAHSTKLAELTGIDDEIINQIKTGWLAVPALAALGIDGLNNLAQVVADTAAGTGKDIQAIALAFQRVAGDTESAFSKLTRAGIVFTEAQKATFDSIFATSGEMAAQQYLIDQLGLKYAGAAEAAANPFARLQVIFENLKEQVGVALLPAIEGMIPVIQEFVDNLTGDPAFAEFLKSLATAFTSLMTALMPLMAPISDLLMALMPPLVKLFEALMPAVLLVVDALMPLIDLIAALAPVVMQVIDAFMPLIAAILEPVSELISLLAPIIVKLIQAFMPLIEAILPPLISIFSTLIDAALIPLLEVILPPLIPLFENLGKGLQWLVTYVLKPLNDAITAVVRSFEKMFAFDGKTINTVVKQSTPGGNVTGIPRINIPGRAQGGGASNTGLSWVGERGPELITMPRGATVTPVPQHLRADALLGSNRGGANQVVYNIQVSGGMGVDGAQLGEQIVTAIRKYERTSGAVFARA